MLSSAQQLRAVQDVQPNIRSGSPSCMSKILEYLARWLRKPKTSSSSVGSSTGNLSSNPRRWSSFWRAALLVLAVLGFAAHVFILGNVHAPGSAILLSNLAQLALGVLMVLTMLEAGKRSSRFGRTTWLLVALAAGIYTIGQAVFTYSWAVAPAQQMGAVIYDSIFFFWIVPLVAAAVADPAEIAEGFEWSSILDFSLLVLLALAVHFSTVLDTLRWQSHPEQMLLWRFKIRLIRDLIVLVCLWSRYVFSEAKQVRAIFLRLGAFYCVYSLCNVIFLFASQARNSTKPGSWVDLVWSAPRLLAIILAATWNWREEIAARRPWAAKWRSYVLDRAPLVVPLLVLAVGAHLFSSSPWIWGGLIAATLAIVSVRLRLAQLRQRRAVDRLHSSTNLLHSIIEGTSEAVFLKDAQGRYLLMNTAGARLLRRTPQEIVGKTDHELFPAQDAESLIKNDKKVMSSGQVVTA